MSAGYITLVTNRHSMKRLIFSLSLIALLTAVTAQGAKSSGLTRLGFAIQMGAFSDVKNAERLAATLQSKGIEAFYYRKDSGIYAVRFGDYPTKDLARNAAKKLVAEHLITSFYVAPPNEVVFAQPKGAGIQKLLPDEIKNLPNHPTAVVPAVKDEQPLAKPAKSISDMGAIAARTAERFVGIPYRWGGDNVVEGLDCSGFARAVYNLCGLNIPRTSRSEERRVGKECRL